MSAEDEHEWKNIAMRPGTTLGWHCRRCGRLKRLRPSRPLPEYALEGQAHKPWIEGLEPTCYLRHPN